MKKDMINAMPAFLLPPNLNGMGYTEKIPSQTK